MSISQDNLFESALSLPAGERADLASQLLQSLRAPAGPVDDDDVASVIEEVRKITQELFPGKCELTAEFDPEFPEDRYVVVNVEASGSPKELVDRNCQWHERIRQLPVNLIGKLRLLIMPV